MKKAVIFLLCFTFIFSITGCSNTEESTLTDSTEAVTTQESTTEKEVISIDTKTLYDEYLKIIKEYESTYGTITVERKAEATNDALGGVSYYTLIDFNADGTEELLIVFDNNTTENDLNGALSCNIHAFTGEKTELVYAEELETDETKKLAGNVLWLAHEGEKVHFVKHITTKKGKSTFAGYKFLEFNGKEFVDYFETLCENGKEKPRYYINSEMVSQDEFIAKNRSVKRYYTSFNSVRLNAHTEQNKFTFEVLQSGKIYTPPTTIEE